MLRLTQREGNRLDAEISETSDYIIQDHVSSLNQLEALSNKLEKMQKYITDLQAKEDCTFCLGKLMNLEVDHSKENLRDKHKLDPEALSEVMLSCHHTFHTT